MAGSAGADGSDVDGGETVPRMLIDLFLGSEDASKKDLVRTKGRVS
jgi:hypothetical protein